MFSERMLILSEKSDEASSSVERKKLEDRSAYSLRTLADLKELNREESTKISNHGVTGGIDIDELISRRTTLVLQPINQSKNSKINCFPI